MKKLFAFMCILMVVFMFSGCDGGHLYDVEYPKPVVIEPDEDTRYTINGYKDTTSSVSDEQTSDEDSSYERLIGNKNSKMLHKVGCSYIKKLKDENSEIFDSLDDAILNGYSKCSRCFK